MFAYKVCINVYVKTHVNFAFHGFVIIGLFDKLVC